MKIFYGLGFIGLACVFLACKEKRPVDRMTDEELKKYAVELAHKDIIVDGHIDFPYRMTKVFSHSDLVIHSEEGDFDLERARQGGLDAPFMSIFIPSTYQQQPDMGRAYADSLINFVTAIPGKYPDQFALANSPEEVKRNTREHKISLPMGMENGAPLGNDIGNVGYFFNRGIRYITLTHSKYNQICGSSGDTTNDHQGLSNFGRRVVKEMNRLGIMVDISHVDDSTFYQVMKMTQVPCIASHSSCRYFAPAVNRDMTDDMIKRMGQNGGVIMINFYTGFLDSVVNRERKKMNQFRAQKGLKNLDSLVLIDERRIKKDYPVSISVVADHIDHVVNLIGVDHVGLGSDFDGVDGFLPVGLKDVSMYPNLVYQLLKRGYSEDDVEKICGGNTMRVWTQVLEKAANK